MHIRDLLDRKPARIVTIEPSAHIGAAISQMLAHHVGGLPVTTHDGKLIGFVSERDILRAVQVNGGMFYQVRVQDIMQQPSTCEASDLVMDAMRRMTGERLRHLVVVDHGKIAGVISVGDIVKERLDELKTEASVLRDYVAAQRAR